MNFDKEQLKYCMACKYAKEQMKKIFFGNNCVYLKNYLENSVIEYDDESELIANFEYSKYLGGRGIEYSSDTEICVQRIHDICYSLKMVLHKGFSVEDDPGISHAKTILEYMLKENVIYADYDDRYKKYQEKSYMKTIAFFMNLSRKLFKEEEENVEREQDLDKWENKRKIMRHLVWDFCNISYTAEYMEDPRNKNRLVFNMGGCFANLFRKTVQPLSDNATRYSAIEKRVKALSDEKQKIFYAFMDIAPKNLGFNMTYIMNKKDMTPQDILKLVETCEICKGKNIGISHIQSFMKCKRPAKNKELIPYICRILLIDEDVLYKGLGMSYGTWKKYLETDFLRRYKEIPEIEDAIKKLKKKKENNENKENKENKHYKEISLARELMRNDIGNLISSDILLSNYINGLNDGEKNEFSEIHKEEKINVYHNREEQFANLIEPDSIYALIKVLEDSESVL